MTRTTFVIARDSRDEATFAAVSVQISNNAVKDGLGGIDSFLAALKEAVTEWVKTTQDGKEAWENSSEDFNIGDLANEKLTSINIILEKKYGITILDIDVFSMDCSPGSWTYDTVLVNTDEGFVNGKPLPHGRCDKCGQPDAPNHACQ